MKYILPKAMIPHSFCNCSIKKCMKDFSRRIKTSWEFIAEFFFHRMFTVSGNQRYHVSVKDQRGQTIFFNMEQKGDHKWKIVDAPKVPDWIMVIEPALNEAIIESMAA